MKQLFAILAICAAVVTTLGAATGTAQSAGMPRSAVSLRQAPFTPDSGSMAVWCGKLLDGTDAAPVERALVVIRDGRIKSITPKARRNAVVATYLPVLDLSKYTCLPGLVDMHTHLTDRPEDTADLTVYFGRKPDETLRLSVENAAATVLAGFTSARNLGTYALHTDTALRDLINKGGAIGPRLQVSGPYLTIPQGGGDLYVPGFKEPADSARFHAGVARGAEDFRLRAEQLIDSGSDLLKVIASGAGPMTVTPPSRQAAANPAFSERNP